MLLKVSKCIIFVLTGINIINNLSYNATMCVRNVWTFSVVGLLTILYNRMKEEKTQVAMTSINEPTFYDLFPSFIILLCVYFLFVSFFSSPVFICCCYHVWVCMSTILLIYLLCNLYVLSHLYNFLNIISNACYYKLNLFPYSFVDNE